MVFAVYEPSVEFVGQSLWDPHCPPTGRRQELMAPTDVQIHHRPRLPLSEPQWRQGFVYKKMGLFTTRIGYLHPPLEMIISTVRLHDLPDSYHLSVYMTFW